MAPGKQAVFSRAGDWSPNKIQAYNNPIFGTSSPDGKQETAITVRPEGGEVDLKEVMYPNSRKLFRRMKYQIWVLYGLIVAHAMVTGYTDPLYTRAPLTQVIVFSAQVGLLIAIIMSFFLLTSQTLYIQLGRYDLYLREFAAIYVTFLLALLLYVALKVYQTVLLYRRVNHLAFWDVTGYTPLWIAQRVVLLLFWVSAMFSSGSVFDEKYFDPEHLVGLAEKKDRGKTAAVATQEEEDGPR